MKIYKLFAIAFIALIAVSAAEAKDRKFGLFVGINAYSGGISPLRGCVNDATKMREAMMTKFGFKAADTTLLTDAGATRASRRTCAGRPSTGWPSRRRTRPWTS